MTTKTFKSKTPGYRSKYSNMKKLGYEFTVDVTGTRRRLEALQCIGWSLTEIGERIGMVQQNMSKLANGRKRIYMTTRDKVAAVYDELSMTPNDTRYSERTRLHAKARGFAPPLSWDSSDIDDPSATPRGLRK